MFNSKTKTIYVYSRIIKTVFNSIVSVGCLCFSLYIFVTYFLGTQNSELINLIFVINIMIAAVAVLINAIYTEAMKNFLFKHFVSECLSIVHSAKMPEKLPKVVYVYTTHNDFMPARVLQNSKQTYENFEVWISDGSTKSEISQEIKEFAQKHNFNLYKLPNGGSKDKADNLNHFLKYSGAKFDYLMISDADEAFDENFVKCNIRFFYSENFIKLAYVSPLNHVYKTKSAFSNNARHATSLALFKRDAQKSYSTSRYPNLYSASCLISNEFLQSIGGLFPDSVLEDWYTEALSLQSGWIGMISSLTVCTQAFDVTAKAYYKRIMRIADWSIKWAKTHPFKKYNEKYPIWYASVMLWLFVPFIFLAGFVVLLVAVWFFVSFWDQIWLNMQFVLSFSFAVFSIVITLLVKSWNAGKICGKGSSFGMFYQILIGFAFLPCIFKHWWLACVRSKYSDFQTTRSPKKLVNSSFRSFIRSVRYDILFFFICCIPLIIINVCFPMYNLIFTNWLWAYLAVNILFVLFALSFLSMIVLQMTSYISTNKNYNPNDFITIENQYILFSKIKNKFYEKHKELERLC